MAKDVLVDTLSTRVDKLGSYRAPREQRLQLLRQTHQERPRRHDVAASVAPDNQQVLVAGDDDVRVPGDCCRQDEIVVRVEREGRRQGSGLDELDAGAQLLQNVAPPDRVRTWLAVSVRARRSPKGEASV